MVRPLTYPAGMVMDSPDVDFPDVDFPDVDFPNGAPIDGTRRSKSKVAAAAERRHRLAGQEAYETMLKAFSDRMERLARTRQGGGAFFIGAGAKRAEEDFAEAARLGHLQTSPRDLQTKVNGLWKMRTDKQWVRQHNHATEVHLTHVFASHVPRFPDTR